VAKKDDVKIQSKPNILVIFGDDIGQSNLSAYSKGVMGYHTHRTSIASQTKA
jgi:arylsulfatase